MAGAASPDPLTVSVLVTLAEASFARASVGVTSTVLNWIELTTGLPGEVRPTQPGAALTVKRLAADCELAEVSTMLAGVMTRPATGTKVTVTWAVPVSADAVLTPTVAGAPRPVSVEQVTEPVTVGLAFSNVFARMLPAPIVSANSVSVTSALTPWILDFDTSIKDHPSFEGFSTTSRGGDRSSDR